MKIGFDIRPLMDSSYSGVSEFTKEILLGMLALDQEDDFRLYYNSFRQVEHRFPEFKQGNVHVTSTHYPNKLFNYIFQKHLHWPKLDRSAEADVFFAPHINFYALSRSCPSILVVHDLSFLRYPHFFSWRKNVWHSQLAAKKLVHEFTKVVAISENTKTDLVELCGVKPEKIEVIHSGIASSYAPVERRSQAVLEARKKYGLAGRFIMTLGTVEPRKNIEGLIKAFEIMLDNNQGLGDLELVIAGGRGWKSEAIIKTWQTSRYRDKIKFIGYVDNRDKSSLYSSAELFVFPSFYEGFGFPPLEAMACGTPVVSSFASSLPEVLGTAAAYADPFDAADMAKAMASVLADEEASADLRKKGLAQAARFTWPAASEKYLKLIRSVR
ncbi:glycosyltransferase family 4 protein [Candidatus Falkowbacteria bacterium]|nr:glycosyltransferase family 4 protein [Candidatus Falkowbacteria bacterium]